MRDAAVTVVGRSRTPVHETARASLCSARADPSCLVSPLRKTPRARVDTFLSVVFVFPLQEAQAYSEENGLLFMETSAKTAMNVNDIFLAIGELRLRVHVRVFCRPQCQRYRASLDYLA